MGKKQRAGTEQGTEPVEIDRSGKRRIQRAGPKLQIALEPRTENQQDYLRSLGTCDLVIAEGPAGTGKTYLAITHALRGVLSGRFNRIVVVRRAVEVDGDRIGYIPGEKEQKLYDYMRPSLDIIADHYGIGSSLQFVMSTGVIEIEHLGAMRGRTLNNAFIFLDEAQNTTEKMMKMILTRVGQKSQIVICGNLGQSDLHFREKSGLLAALDRFAGVEGFGIHRFSHDDIQRSDLVKKIMTHWPDDQASS